MDAQMLYSLLGILIFIVIIILTLRNPESKKIQTKQEKQFEILNAYKKQLRIALEPLENDNEARLAKKSELLKKFSDELAMNIFFDKFEIKEMILELSQ